MPRTARPTPGGYAYHVLNRGVRRLGIFDADGDYLAFEQLLGRLVAEHPGIRLLTYCLMPNHWHLLLWPRGDKALAPFMQRLTLTHTLRWQRYRNCAGTGHLYQGRYRSFPIQRDDHFLTVARYVERNALRANLVRRAEEWRWSGLWMRRQGSRDQRRMLSGWPVREPRQWIPMVNAPQNPKELDAVRRSVRTGRPFGGAQWVGRAVEAMGVAFALRSRGRPRKADLGSGAQGTTDR